MGKCAHPVLGALGVAIATVLLGLLAAVIAAYSGIYDVSARGGHSAAMRWFLDTTMHSSVRARADGDGAQAMLAAADIDAGASEYKSMCEHCHGGPGVEPAGWSRGMVPRPPQLARAATEWEPAEVAWIVGNGIRSTGMPAFGDDHDDAALWNIAAFVERLPAMTPADYRQRGGKDHDHARQHGAGGSHEHPQ